MVISISNMHHFLQYSIYYWLWLFLSYNAALLVLVCSQCCTTRHSACLWRCISHLVFGILPVGSLMFSWQTVCHQVLAAGHLKPHSWPFQWARVEYAMYVCVSVGESMLEVVRLRVNVCACICAEGRFLESHTGPQLGIKYPPGNSLRKRLECLAVCPAPFWHAGPRVLLSKLPESL